MRAGASAPAAARGLALPVFATNWNRHFFMPILLLLLYGALPSAIGITAACLASFPRLPTVTYFMGVCSFVMSNPGDCSLPYLEKRFYSAYLHQHLLHFPSCSASSLPARQLRPPALRGARQRISLSALVFLLTHHGDRSLSSPENALHCFSHQHPLHAALLIAFNTCVLALLIVLDIYALTPLYVNALVLMHMAILSVSPSLVTTHFFLSSILRAAPALAVLSARARAASAPSGS